MCRASLPAAQGQGTEPYRECPRCEGVFLWPAPTNQPNVVFEGPEGVRRQAELESAREAYFRRHLERLEEMVGTSTTTHRLMEIGCGSGVLLKMAWERGWRAGAIELSADLARLAVAAQPGAQVTIGDASDPGVWSGAFDAVLALDVLEHVLEPYHLLGNIHQHLKPGGVVLIQTPNTRGLRHRLQGRRWEMRDPSQHINLFSPRGLTRALERAGFAVLSLRTVSGTGLERGWRREAAAAKEWLLNRRGLGNALVVGARRR